MEYVRSREAAEMVGVSYPTLKQWIYKGKIRTVKTPGGHHRIPLSEVTRLTSGATRGPRRPKPAGLAAISGRNQLLGTVVSVQYDGFLAKVTMDVGGQSITSIITRDASEDLGLKKGVRAYALVKATEVMVIRG